MAKAHGRSARPRKTKTTHRELDKQFLWTRLVWLTLAVGWLLTAAALLSFDAADAPSHVVYPHNDPTLNLIGLVGSHVAYAMLKLIGFGVVPVMFAWMLALVFSASGRPSGHPLIRSAGVVLITLSVSGCQI